MRPTRIALAVALALLLPTLAAADHTWTHRYTVYGRVLGDDGAPLAETRLQFASHGLSVAGLCEGWGEEHLVTDAFGDFEVCLHVHEAPPDRGLSVHLDDQQYVNFVDPDFRASAWLLRVATRDGGPFPDDWRTTYQVEGSLFQMTEPGTVEGIRVNGHPMVDERVELSLSTGGETFTGEARTNEWGRYAATFHLPFAPEDGNLTFTAANHSFLYPLNLTFMRTQADLKLKGDGPPPADEPSEDAPPVFDARFPDNDLLPQGVPPGTEAPPFVGSPAFWLLALALVAVAAAGLALVVRRR